MARQRRASGKGLKTARAGGKVDGLGPLQGAVDGLRATAMEEAESLRNRLRAAEERLEELERAPERKRAAGARRSGRSQAGRRTGKGS